VGSGSPHANELDQAAREALEDAESRRDTMLRDADQAAADTRGQADEEARTALAEARDATNLVWQEAQQERALVEAETTRLQAFRQDMLEHLTDAQARLGSAESADAWHDFLADLKDRGLASPLLVISDGAPGLIGAIEQIYPKALRQRCLIHRSRNILSKIPAGMQAEAKEAYWAIFDTAGRTAPPGPDLVATIDARIDAFADKYRALYPAAIKILLTDRAGLTAYLRFPPSTTTASGTPTSSKEPSARPAAGSRSSAGSPARPAASPWSGPCSTVPPAAGAV
jgi:hypothetical protein